jgi:hypothetical protein
VFCFGEEVGKNTLIELCLSDRTALEKLLPGAIEGAVEKGEESNGFFAENLSVKVGDRSCNVHALKDGVGGSHRELFSGPRCLGMEEGARGELLYVS